MVHKLNIIREIVPEKSVIEKWAESPVGWWNVTTEGDCEGRTTNDLGTFYGHVAEIALSLKGCSYSLRFSKAECPTGVSVNSSEEQRITRQIVTKKTNISFDCYFGKNVKMVEKWLDCPEIKVSDSNYYETYTITLVD